MSETQGETLERFMGVIGFDKLPKLAQEFVANELLEVFTEETKMDSLQLSMTINGILCEWIAFGGKKNDSR